MENFDYKMFLTIPEGMSENELQNYVKFITSGFHCLTQRNELKNEIIIHMSRTDKDKFFSNVKNYYEKTISNKNIN